MNSAKSSDPMPGTNKTIIAIDGYSSCGKSTFAKLIARELGYVYIDSGAMYRSVALYCLDQGIITGGVIDIARLLEELDRIDIRFRPDPLTGDQQTWLNGVNVEERIRGIEVSSVVSDISKIGEVRARLVSLQRQIGKNGRVVMDGRDIGTVVFPDARLKIFMTADPEVRARRRYDELVQKGMDVSFGEIARNIRTRDHIDANREMSPLRKADDALVLDNSHMTVTEQMDWFREKWNGLHAARGNCN